MDNNQNNNDMQKQIDNIFNEISNSNESNITTVNTNIPSSMPTNNTQSFGVEPPKKKSKVGLVILILGLLLVAVSVFFLFIKPNLGKNTDKGTANNKGTTEKTKIEKGEVKFTVKLYDKEFNIYDSYAATLESILNNYTLYYRMKSDDLTLTSDNLDDYLKLKKDDECVYCNSVILLRKGETKINGNNNLISINGIKNKEDDTLRDYNLDSVRYPALSTVLEKPEIEINGLKFIPEKTTKEEIIKVFGDNYKESDTGGSFWYRDYNNTGFNIHFHYSDDNNNIIRSISITKTVKIGG